MEAEVKNRRNAETLETFAWALSEVDRRQEAQVVIEEAILQGTQNSLIFGRAGNIARALGHVHRAEQYFRQASNLNSQFKH